MEGYISDSVYVANKKRNSLINRKIICRVLGVLLLVEVCMLLTCVGVAWGYGEQDGLAFLLSAGITALAAGLLLLAGRKAERRMSKRDGYCVAALTWVLFSFFGMLPFLLSHSVPTVADAFFETMSGFTTTGATIMDDIDSQSHAILFWRALTHWIGGLGIVFFAIAILPAFSEGGNLQLFSAEAVGVTHDKIHPKVSTMARWLWTIYLILTVSQTILLWLGGMGWFDSVCQTFATLATGGFSTKQASIAYWNSPYIEYVTAIFMVLAGINFSLYFSCLKGKFGKIWRDEETRWFLGSILMLTLCIAAALVLKNGYGVEEAFRKAFFQVVTLHTSTGFATDGLRHGRLHAVAVLHVGAAHLRHAGGRLHGVHQRRHQEPAPAHHVARHPQPLPQAAAPQRRDADTRQPAGRQLQRGAQRGHLHLPLHAVHPGGIASWRDGFSSC